MIAGSLFSGIGGLDLAVEMAGHKVVWQAEWEKAPSALLARRFGVPVYGDVDGIDYRSVEPVELLIGGGFPCQSLSSAGLRRGRDDPRWKWPEVVRAVRTLRPRVVVLENVDAISRFRGEFGDVCRSLAELGYCVRWGVLAASEVGACHGRKRWFAVVTDAQRFRRERGGRARDGRPGFSDGAAPDPDGRRLQERGKRDGQTPQDSPNGHPRGDHVDGRDEVAPDAQRQPVRDFAGEVGTATGTLKGPGTQRQRIRIDDGNGGSVDWGVYEPGIRRHEQVLGRRPPDPLDDRGRLSVSFVEWMQMFPGGWVTDNSPHRVMSRTQQLKALGNACVPAQGYAALTALGLPILGAVE